MSSIIPGQNALPSVLYLDHAQVKLLCRRLLHIKEKLDNENMEFLKTKPGKFAAAMMHDTSDKISVVNDSQQPNKRGNDQSPHAGLKFDPSGMTLNKNSSINSLAQQQALSVSKPKTVREWVDKQKVAEKKNEDDENEGMNDTKSSLMQRA